MDEVRKALKRISDKYHSYDFSGWGPKGLYALEDMIREMGKIADQALAITQPLNVTRAKPAPSSKKALLEELYQKARCKMYSSSKGKSITEFDLYDVLFGDIEGECHD